MATTDSPVDESGPYCARDFVTEKLQEADSPLTPSGMASEYGCTNGHVRNLLMDLVDDGVAERVAHGKYVAADDGSDEDEELLADIGDASEGNAQAEEGAVSAQETTHPTTEETSEQSDGPAPSEDPDTEAMDTPESGESMGVPLPVSANVVLAGAAVFLLFMLWRGSRSSSSPPDQSSDEDDVTPGEEVALVGEL